MTTKRWLVTIHILFGAIMFGNTITFIVLNIAATKAPDIDLMQKYYDIMYLLSITTVRGSTFATIITGILLSILTKWGLFKFYWIIAKEILSVILLGLNIWGMYVWTNRALDLARINDIQPTNLSHVQIDIWIGIVIQLISLILIYVLSVFKPRGGKLKNKRGVNVG